MPDKISQSDKNSAEVNRPTEDTSATTAESGVISFAAGAKVLADGNQLIQRLANGLLPLDNNARQHKLAAVNRSYGNKYVGQLVRAYQANNAEATKNTSKPESTPLVTPPNLLPTISETAEPKAPQAATAQPAQAQPLLATALPTHKPAESAKPATPPAPALAKKLATPATPAPLSGISVAQKKRKAQQNKKGDKDKKDAPALNMVAPETPIAAPPEAQATAPAKAADYIPSESAAIDELKPNIHNPNLAAAADTMSAADLKNQIPPEEVAGTLQRAKVEIPEKPLAPPTPAPKNHSGFVQATGQLKQTGTQEKKHEPTAEKQGDILESSQPPANEAETLAESKQVGKMEQAPTGEFDKNAFIEKMMQAAGGIAPKDENELKDFPKSGKTQGLKNDAQADVKTSQENAQKDLQKTSKETPNQGEVKTKTVTPLDPEKPGAKPQVTATQAVPDAKPASASDLSYGPTALNAAMNQNDPIVTPDYMATVPDPTINNAAQQKNELDKNTQQATNQFLQQEQNLRQTTKSDVQSGVTQGVSQIHEQRTQDFTDVSGEQTESKGKDDARYQKIMGELNIIYEDTKKTVDDILEKLPGKVDGIFGMRADMAAQIMNTSIQSEIDQLKGDRTNVFKEGFNVIGNAINDNTKGVPKELVEPIYKRGKDKYIENMRELATLIADIIDQELKKAKKELAIGRQKVQDHLKTLPEDLQEIGQQAADDINSKFDELGDKVTDAVQNLESSMTEKFQEAGQKADAMLKELREKNRGWLDKVASAIGDALSMITEIKDKILALFNKAKNVILKIIQDPLGFAGNLIKAGVKGLEMFISHFPDHLKKGMLTWLSHILGGTIELPANFDFQGILSIGLQVMGISVNNLKERAKKIVGAEAMEQFEEALGFITSLGGKVENIVNLIKEQLSPEAIIATVFNGIKDWAINKVIQMAVTKIVTMFVPGGGLLQIIDTVIKFGQFLIENASQLADFANSILDSVESIANGNIDEAAGKVETTLANALPLAISMLAKLLNLDKIGDVIKGIIKKIQGPVNKAIDFVVGKVGNKFKQMMLALKKQIERLKKLAKSTLDKGKRKLVTSTNKIKTKLGLGEQKINSKSARLKQETSKGDQELAQYPTKVSSEVTKGQQALSELIALPGGAQEAAKYKQELGQIQTDATKQSGEHRQTLSKTKTTAETDASKAKNELKQQKNLADTTKQQANQKLSPFGNAFATIKNVLKGGVPAATAALKAVQTAVAEAGKLVEKALSKAKETISKVQSKIQNLTSTIRSGITALKNKIKAGITALKNKLKKFVERVKALIHKLKNLVLGVRDGTNFLKQKDKSAQTTKKALPGFAAQHPGIKLNLVKDSETEKSIFYYVHGEIQRAKPIVEKPKGKAETAFSIEKLRKEIDKTASSHLKDYYNKWRTEASEYTKLKYNVLEKKMVGIKDLVFDDMKKLKTIKGISGKISEQVKKEGFLTKELVKDSYTFTVVTHHVLPLDSTNVRFKNWFDYFKNIENAWLDSGGYNGVRLPGVSPKSSGYKQTDSKFIKNLIWYSKNIKKIGKAKPYHLGPHTTYTDKVNKKIQTIVDSLSDKIKKSFPQRDIDLSLLSFDKFAKLLNKSHRDKPFAGEFKKLAEVVSSKIENSGGGISLDNITI